MIRPATLDDARAIAAIYNPYVTGSTITFEEQEVTAEDMRARISEVTTHLPWLVFERDSAVVGYAYATRWRTRSAYRFASETTVYLSPSYQRQGIGRQLYMDLLRGLQVQGIHCAIGGIALPNEASVRLHESLGFKQVAQFQEVGYKFGRWIDVGYWQRLVGTSADAATLNEGV